jgi:hypothetical protein
MIYDCTDRRGNLETVTVAYVDRNGRVIGEDERGHPVRVSRRNLLVPFTTPIKPMPRRRVK